MNYRAENKGISNVGILPLLEPVPIFREEVRWGRLFLRLFFLIILLLPFSGKAQHIIGNNLVPNPSFEDYTQCPINSTQLIFAFPWNDCWDGIGSSDYFNNCSTSAYIISMLNQQMPRSGNGEVGILLFDNHFLNNNGREYIEVGLKTDLHKAKTYCTDFFVSLRNTAQYAIENIQAYFSVTKVLQNPMIVLPYIPQIKNKKGIINDTTNWVRISGNFKAIGGEKFITIGNFDSTINTNYIFVNYGVVHAYYFIDDVSVCECSFDINLGADTSLCEGESFILNPNLPNATYTWQDSSHATTYEVKQPGTYWVRAYVADYDIYSTDTIIITAGDDSFCNPPLTIPNIITPNGDSQNDNFLIQNAESYDIALQIYNRWGNIIYETTNYQNDFSCKDCADGVYYYVLKTKSKRNGREKEYKGSLTVIK